MLFDSSNASNVPETLKKLTQWVNWRFKTVKNGKKTKVPVNPHTLGNAASDVPATWGTFDQTVTRTQETPGRYGVGFMFTPPFVGIDLDHCVVGGVLNPYAVEVLGTFKDTYAEWSPSGEGVHILCQGSIHNATKTAQYEIYTEKRFFTVTGEKLQGHPRDVRHVTEEGQSWLAEMTATQEGSDEYYPEFDPADDAAPPLLMFQALEDSEPRFNGVWTRKATLKGPKGDSSDSAFEMALARYAVNGGWDDQNIFKLLVSWRVMHKLPEKHLKALQATISTAHEGWKESEEDRLLDAHESLGDVEKKHIATAFLGLDIVHIIQMGRDPSAYRVELQGGVRIDLGTFAQFSDKKTWERIVFEHTGRLPVLTVKRWIKVRAVLLSLVAYEDSKDTSDAAETESWVVDYTKNKQAQRSDYDLVRQQDTFREDGWRYLALNKLLVHVQVNFRASLTRIALASRLRVLGWEQADVRRKGADSEGNPVSIHMRYWKYQESVQTDTGE